MKRSEILLMILQVPVDFFMLVFAALAAYYVRFFPLFTEVRQVSFHIEPFSLVHLAGIVALCWIPLFAMLGLYTPDANRKFGQEIVRIIIGCAAGLGGLAVYLIFTLQVFDSRFLLLISTIFSIIFIILGRMLVRGLRSLLHRGGTGLRRIAVIGNDVITKTIIDTLEKRKELGYHVVKVFSHFNKQAEGELKKLFLDEVLFTNPRAHEDEALSAIEYCRQHHLVFKYSADMFAMYSSNTAVYPIAGFPIVELRKTSLSAWGRVTKRLFDIVASLLFMILFSPVYAIVAIIILLETGRPIIYKNERIGIRGNHFFVYKFRSMFQKDSTGPQFGIQGKIAQKKEVALIKSKNSKSGPIYKIANDPRVTPFGRCIRRFSIDEFPQFFNVLQGTMSIVGPRPHQPREVVHYEKEYKEIFTLKPGITGLAQISGRSDLSFEDEVKLDIYYTEKWSLLLDFIIFLKTPFILFRKRKVE